MKIELLDHCASDLAVVNAARVSLDKWSDGEWLKTCGCEGDDLQFCDHLPDHVLACGDDKLISFLMKNRHGSPFEHGYFQFRVEAPIFVFREWHRHRVGHCLPGSALITTQNRQDSSQRRIDDLWKLKHEGVLDSLGRRRILPSCQHPSLRVLQDDGYASTALAAAILQSGMKDVLELRHEQGNLRCTADHRIQTREGWKRAADLEVGDRLAYVTRVWREEDRSIPPSLRRGIGVWTTMQRRLLIGKEDICYLCGKTFSFDELELDHVVPVSADLSKALDADNLAPACTGCHASKTFGLEQPSRQGQGRLGIIDVRVQSAPTYVAHEMTYDIEMSGPLHNFVADGIVVHNSYNEMSGRYTEMEKKFYLPDEARVQVGRPGAYTFEPDPSMTPAVHNCMMNAYETAWANYQEMLDIGVAKEQARTVLPLGLYSKMIWSCNPRSLMHFISLRTHPQAMEEIRTLANAAGMHFDEIMPVTSQSFIDNSKVAP